VTTRALPLRARVAPAPDGRAASLWDPLTDDVVRGGPLARERFATRWADTDALRRLADAKRAPLDAALAAAMAEQHRRLGAPPASLAALERLARGEAVAVVAGQQPAPLGGPLYAFHKIASAVGLAAEAAARAGLEVVPLFWVHGEDSDFAEVRHAMLADAALQVADLALPEDAHTEGGLVGNVPLAPLAALEAQALARWDGLPGAPAAGAALAAARAAARDLGEAYAALALALFGAHGLVVVDPRVAAFRAAARPIVERYLAAADALHEAARRAGARLEALGARRALDDRALESFVFAIEDGSRHKIPAAGARARAALSPSVALRPAVQDGVFPTIGMACGPGELAYLAQLREVFEGVGVRPACAVPRFGATWLPAQAIALLEASGADPWELVTGADAVLRRHAEAAVPEAARAALAAAHAAALDGLARVAEAARAVDPSLPQMVDSARAKVDFQYQRLHEGLVGKVRHQLERRHPEWARLRYYLLPGDRLQERRLCGLEPIVRRGPGAAEDMVELAAQHARGLAAGEHTHALVDLA